VANLDEIMRQSDEALRKHREHLARFRGCLRPVTPALTELIEKWIADYTGPHGDTELVRRFLALKLFADMGGTTFLRSNGEFFVVEHDRPGQMSLEVPLQVMSIVHAARRYPELQALLPLRPRSAVDCSTCDGTGWLFRENAKIRPIGCGTCFGLGWIDQADEVAAQRMNLWEIALAVGIALLVLGTVAWIGFASTSAFTYAR
jgi:hypothetical protein